MNSFEPPSGLSRNTQAILLLIAPLLSGRETVRVDLLSATDYRRLARFLHEMGREPADLIGPDAPQLIQEIGQIAEPDRVRRLLDRGFSLSQAVERWQSRSLWVLSRADTQYPNRLRTRLRSGSPPLLYGAGNPALLENGGLAVVGSRHVTETVATFALDVGAKAAEAGIPIVSGGARGIDQSAMVGAAQAGGVVIGVLADRLERAALSRENRNLIRDGRGVLISPYDPAAGFNVGHAMQRNKLIYALADAGLVVSSDLNKGGTWAGAVEQLDRLRFVPIYVRGNGDRQPGLEALQRKGALTWPEPATPDEFVTTISSAPSPAVSQTALFVGENADQDYGGGEATESIEPEPYSRADPPESELSSEVPNQVVAYFKEMHDPRSLKAIAEDLEVSQKKASTWLKEAMSRGMLVKLRNPVRYRAEGHERSLFD